MTAVAATTLSIGDVNARLKEMLSQFNNETTAIDFAFSLLEFNEKNVISVGFGGLFEKKGEVNELKFKLTDLSYNFNAGVNPTVNAEASLDLDMVKAIGHTNINEMGDMAVEFLKDSIREIGEKYGDAISVIVEIDKYKTDDKGNLSELAFHLDINIDPEKLPEDLPVEELEILSTSVVFDFNLARASLGLNVVMNPKYKRFGKDGEGLKEVLEALVAGDEEIWEGFKVVFEGIDDFVTEVVNHDAQAEEEE